MIREYSGLSEAKQFQAKIRKDICSVILKSKQYLIKGRINNKCNYLPAAAISLIALTNLSSSGNRV
jgi:hypothetical protein